MSKPWYIDKRILGKRAAFNKKRRLQREQRRAIVRRLYVDGMEPMRILAELALNYQGMFPISRTSVYRDLEAIRRQLDEEGRCPTCGARRTPYRR